MIFKAKGNSQSAQAEYDQTDIYEQFRPAWFHFTSGSPEQQRAANTFHSKRTEEVVLDVHPSKVRSSESKRVYTAPPKGATKSTSYTRDQSFLALCKRLWIDEELFFSMSKLSLLGMVIGLMFLGALFFLSGFLMAVNLYGIGAPKTEAHLAAQGQSFNPQHMPTPGYTQGHAQTHNPAGFQANRDINASVHPHYASVGGVAMMPSQRLPSNMNHHQKHASVPSYAPTRGMIAGVPQQQARPYYPPPPQPLVQPTAYPSYPQQQGAPVYGNPPAGVAPIGHPAAPSAAMPTAPSVGTPAVPAVGIPVVPSVGMHAPRAPSVATPATPQLVHY